MGKIAMIKSRYGKHAHQIGCQCHPQRNWTPTHKKQEQTDQMHENKRNYPQPVNRFTHIIGYFYIAVIKPDKYLGKHGLQEH
jgi:hypothetical protein